MNLGLAVAEFLKFDIEKNLITIEQNLKYAERIHIDILFFGEAVLNGYNGLTWNIEKDIEKYSIDQGSEYIQELQNLAFKRKTGIGLGYYERSGERIYDSYLIISRKGEILINYRRISSGWKPKGKISDMYSNGTEPGIFSYQGKEFGVLISGDLWANEYLKNIRFSTVDVLLWPLYINYSLEDWKERKKNAYKKRAKQSGKDTLIINSLKKDDAIGGAYFISRDNDLSEELPPGMEGILKISI